MHYKRIFNGWSLRHCQCAARVIWEVTKVMIGCSMGVHSGFAKRLLGGWHSALGGCWGVLDDC